MMYKAFETKEQAREFEHTNGGVMVSKTRRKQDYIDLVYAVGLDTSKYPYAVIWHE